MNTHYYTQVTIQALVAALLTLTVLCASFFLVEPQVSQAVVGTPFTIKTNITDEISFLVQASNVTATGSINGLTGGTANGSTTVVVQSNNSAGYYMTIAFTSNGSGQAMLGDVSGSDSIRDYPATSSQPTFLFSTASTSAVFAYTVSAVDSSDLDPSFLNNGSACNTGAGYTADRCWMEPMTTSYQIVNRTSEAGSGSTSTIHFRISVPNNPQPSLEEDIYTATATLTALNT
jgi:hypothetical protein